MLKSYKIALMNNLKFFNLIKITGILKNGKKLYIDASHPNETRIVLKSKVQLKNMNLKIKII